MTAREYPRCPRCGGLIPNSAQPGAYPGALSRWDNKTEVCSECGSDEALIQFGSGHAALHPVAGHRPWVHQPPVAEADLLDVGPIVAKVRAAANPLDALFDVSQTFRRSTFRRVLAEYNRQTGNNLADH